MKNLAVNGGLAVGLSQLVRIAAQAVSVVVLARLLRPGDFGLVAALAPVLAFVALFQGLGLQQAIVRDRSLDAEQLTRIFWLTLAASFACAGLVAAAAPVVAAFYHEDRLRLLTLAAAVPLVVAGLASVPMALLARDLRFGRVALIDGGCAVAGLVAAIAAASLGAGYWSLLAATFAATTLNLAAGWFSARWWPGRPSWRLPDRAVLGFGANLTGFTVVNFFARNLDNVLIGRVWGAVALGFYDRAYTLMLFPLQAINGPLSGVMIPLLSRIEADKPQLRVVYLRTMGQVVLLAVPGLAALVATSDDVVGMLFGPGWAPIAPIFTWLGVAGMLQPIGNSTGWLFIAQGRTRAMFRWGLYGSATTVAAFFAGLHWGAVGIAGAYTITEYFLRTPVLYWFLGRVGPVRMGDFVRLQAPLLVAAAATIAARRWLLPGLHGAAAVAAAVVFSYAMGILAVRLSPGGRDRLADSVGLARHLVARRLPARKWA